MKTRLLTLLAIGMFGSLVPYTFGVTEELIHGNSSIELLPNEIIPGKPTSFEIKFQYTEGPYALDNFIPVIEVNPASAKPYITIDVKPTGVTNRQILRIPVSLTVDPQIEHEKIFLSISFSGDHFSSRSDAIYKSAWSEYVILNILSKEFLSTNLPSSQDYEFDTLRGARCDGEISPCYGTFTNGTSIPIQCDYPHSCGVVSFDNVTKDQAGTLEDYEIISWDDIEYQSFRNAAVFTKNMTPRSILDAGEQFFVIQKVDFRDDNFAKNSTFNAVVGYALQKGDQMVHPPRGENVTDVDHREFGQQSRKQNNEFYQESEIAKSFEFLVDPEKPFFVKSSLTIQESGLYTHQFYKKLKFSPAVISSNMGGTVVVDKFSKAIDENGVCKNDDFRRLIKHDYSTVVCVDGETAWKLIGRGWGK